MNTLALALILVFSIGSWAQQSTCSKVAQDAFQTLSKEDTKVRAKERISMYARLLLLKSQHALRQIFSDLDSVRDNLLVDSDPESLLRNSVNRVGTAFNFRSCDGARTSPPARHRSFRSCRSGYLQEVRVGWFEGEENPVLRYPDGVSIRSEAPGIIVKLEFSEYLIHQYDWRPKLELWFPLQVSLESLYDRDFRKSYFEGSLKKSELARSTFQFVYSDYHQFLLEELRKFYCSEDLTSYSLGTTSIDRKLTEVVKEGVEAALIEEARAMFRGAPVRR